MPLPPGPSPALSPESARAGAIDVYATVWREMYEKAEVLIAKPENTVKLNELIDRALVDAIRAAAATAVAEGEQTFTVRLPLAPLAGQVWSKSPALQPTMSAAQVAAAFVLLVQARGFSVEGASTLVLEVEVPGSQEDLTPPGELVT